MEDLRLLTPRAAATAADSALSAPRCVPRRRCAPARPASLRLPTRQSVAHTACIFVPEIDFNQGVTTLQAAHTEVARRGSRGGSGTALSPRASRMQLAPQHSPSLQCMPSLSLRALLTAGVARSVSVHTPLHHPMSRPGPRADLLPAERLDVGGGSETAP
jgi:hypothetical protein